MDDFGFADWSLLEFVENAVVECGPTEKADASAVVDLARERSRRAHPTSRSTRPTGA